MRMFFSKSISPITIRDRDKIITLIKENNMQLVTENSYTLDVANKIEQSIIDATHVIEEYNSKNSLISFQKDIRYLKNWFLENNIHIDHDLKKEHMILFIMSHCEKHKLSTIKRRIASLSRYLQLKKLPNPCRDKELSILMTKLTEKYGSSKAWGQAITLSVLNDMLNTCHEDGIKGIRDSALLLFGFSTGGRRRTEISNATMENLTDNGDGTFIYNLGKSKTNKTGQYDPKPIVGRAAAALRRWLFVADIKEGAIFRGINKSGVISDKPICDKQIARIVKYRCEKAGYDPTQYTAHSLRSGFVTESGKKGKPLGDVMAMTGHRSLKEVMRYYQTGNILNNSAAYLAG